MHRYTFLQTNDVHWRGNNPKGRVDDYPLAITAKILEIFQLARDISAEAILVPGDLTDTFGLGYKTVGDLAILLKQTPCPILAIAGQHDQSDHNPGSHPRLPIGLLFKLGLIIDVAENPYYFGSPIVVRVTGRHYNTDADTTEDYYEMPPKPDGCQFATIHLAHGTVVEKAPGFDMRCTPIADIKTSADILCVGDYHVGTGIQRVGNTFVINPGALGRKGASISEIDRQVQVARIDVEVEYNGYDGTAKFKTELIPLRSVQPGHEVLSREHIEVEAEREGRINRFLGLLAADGEMTFLETQGIVDHIAKQDSIPKAIVDETLRRIGQAREQLGGMGNG